MASQRMKQPHCGLAMSTNLHHNMRVQRVLPLVNLREERICRIQNLQRQQQRGLPMISAISNLVSQMLRSILLMYQLKMVHTLKTLIHRFLPSILQHEVT